MMRKICLIRHGKRDGEKAFVGMTDIPLNQEGREETEILSKHLPSAVGIGKAPPLIFNSPLKRCVETAGIIAKAYPGVKPVVKEDLHEINLGAWEGRTRAEIKSEFPDEYAKRGANIGTYRIPGGESFLDCGRRFSSAVEEIRDISGKDRDIIIVAHAGVIRAYLTMLLKKDMDTVFDISLPCSSVTLLLDDGTLRIQSVGARIPEMLTDKEIRRLYEKYRVPERVIRHMGKTAECAADLFDGLDPAVKPDRELTIKACLVHDLLRGEKNHAKASADALRAEGYLAIAPLVEKHHDPEYIGNPGLPVSEEELLFYADKIVLEDRIVSIEERFSKSLEKCHTEEAKKKHGLMYRKALKIQEKIENSRRR